jgi:hypothetical protein
MDADSTRRTRSQDNGAVRVSQLNLVDLAGSERIKHTGAEVRAAAFPRLCCSF